MCTVSGKLKLCTCKTKDVWQLKHYWILKRHNGENCQIIGEAILPAEIGERANRINENIICKSLNDGNCFDVELLHQENDILELHFTLNAGPEKNNPAFRGNYLAYAFKYKKGSWRKTVIDPFSANLDDIQKGMIVHPFEKR